MSKKKASGNWTPGFRVSQPAVAVTQWAPSRMGPLDAVISLGMITGSALFFYGVAQESSSALVKTTGYAMAGFLGALLIGGFIKSVAE